MLLKALQELQLTGDSLMASLIDLPLPEAISSALSLLHQKGVHPTFAKLIKSQTDTTAAKGILLSLLGGLSHPLFQWKALTENVVSMCDLLYGNILSREEALDLVAERFVLDEDNVKGKQDLELLLTLDKCEDNMNSLKLNAEKSGKAGKTMMLRVGLCRELELVHISSDLGSLRLPIQICRADPRDFLKEIIDIADNYKKGKRIARVAQLLRIETPVASALANCALAAVEKRDEATLAGYLKEIFCARNLGVVNKLCMKLISTNLLPYLRDDILACALANSPEEELEKTLEALSATFGIVGESIESAEVLSAKEPRLPEIPIPNGFPLDPSYTPIDRWEGTERNYEEKMKEERRMRLMRGRSHELQLVEAARLLGAQSATAAVGVGVWCEGEQWTANDKLNSYALALLKFRSLLSPPAVERIPPQALIDRMIREDAESTPLDRLPTYGCERERFIEDSTYRTDTIDGIAMTEDESQWKDAISLAKSFGGDLWRTHIASLDHLLTSTPPEQARILIAARQHQEVLMQQPARLYAHLRKTVLPLICTEDSYLLYVEQFGNDTPEAASLPLLRFLQAKGERNTRHTIASDDALTKLLILTEEYDTEKLVQLIRQIGQRGDIACEAAARAAIRSREPLSKLRHFIKTAESFIDMLVDESDSIVEDVEYYLEQVNSAEELREALERKKEEMAEAKEDSFLQTDASPYHSSFSLIQRRKH